MFVGGTESLLSIQIQPLIEGWPCCVPASGSFVQGYLKTLEQAILDRPMWAHCVGGKKGAWVR